MGNKVRFRRRCKIDNQCRSKGDLSLKDRIKVRRICFTVFDPTNICRLYIKRSRPPTTQLQFDDRLSHRLLPDERVSVTKERHRSVPPPTIDSRDPREDIQVIRISTSEVGIPNSWRVYGVENYDNGTPNLKIIYLKPLCVGKSDIVMICNDQGTI